MKRQTEKENRPYWSAPLFCPIILSFLVISCVYGDWRYQNDIDASIMALGGAGTALSGSPAAIYWNPAGIVGDSKFNVLFSCKKSWGKVLYPWVTSKVLYETSHSLPTFLGVVRNFSRFSFCVAWDVPYESYEKMCDWIIVNRINAVSGGLAIKFKENTVIGGKAAYTVKKYVYVSDWKDGGKDSKIDLSGNKGYELGLGLIHNFSKFLKIGATIKSGRINPMVKTFTPAMDTLIEGYAPIPVTIIVAGEKLPFFYSSGIIVTPRANLHIRYDINYIIWSGVVKVKSDWQDVTTQRIRHRIGIEYNPTNALYLRMGLYNEPSPRPEEYYKWDQIFLTTGIGYEYRSFNISVALLSSEIIHSEDKKEMDLHLSLMYQSE